METRRLGNTDLDLTPIGFGTWAIGGGDWGMGWGPQEEKDSIGSILEGLEAGINWIDTAHAYGFGLSEEVVGKALREWGQPVIVATKCGVLSNADKTPRRFASRELILDEVEGSLRRLQVETIDLYQLHWPEPDVTVIRKILTDTTPCFDGETSTGLNPGKVLPHLFDQKDLVCLKPFPV